MIRPRRIRKREGGRRRVEREGKLKERKREGERKGDWEGVRMRKEKEDEQ